MDLFATCEAGLEQLLAAELLRLGGEDPEPGARGVAFRGDDRVLARVNLASRIAARVIMPLAAFDAASRDELFRGALDVDWARWIAPGRTIAVDAVGRARHLDHTGFVAQVAKDAICDRLRADRGARPDVDRRSPDVPVSVRLLADRCTIGLDASGTRLHRRGYRREGGEAPLRETLAAGVLALAGFAGDRPLLDPMCGSGTFVVEAAMVARRRAPGLLRLAPGGEGFALQRWVGHDPLLFDEVVRELREAELPRCGARVVGGDRDAGALSRARRNAERAGVAGDVELLHEPLDRAEPPGEAGLVVTNPPYGERLGRGSDLVALYRQLGDLLKRRFQGHDAWVLTGDLSLGRSVGLRPSQRIPLWNGAIECRLLHFELYSGSRR